MGEMYYCNLCHKRHQTSSRIGRRHIGSKNTGRALGKPSISIKWTKSGKDWKSGHVYLGKGTKFKYKADVYRAKMFNKIEYHVDYKVYDPDRQRWLDYNSRQFTYDKPDDTKAFRAIKSMAPI